MITEDDTDAVGAAFDAVFRVDPEDSRGDHAKKRRVAEKRIAIAARPDDGRRKRATGRTVQFNVNMRPEVKKKIVEAARRSGVSITVWVEAAALAHMDKKGA